MHVIPIKKRTWIYDSWVLCLKSSAGCFQWVIHNELITIVQFMNMTTKNPEKKDLIYKYSVNISTCWIQLFNASYLILYEPNVGKEEHMKS